MALRFFRARGSTASAHSAAAAAAAALGGGGGPDTAFCDSQQQGVQGVRLLDSSWEDVLRHEAGEKGATGGGADLAQSPPVAIPGPAAPGSRAGPVERGGPVPEGADQFQAGPGRVLPLEHGVVAFSLAPPSRDEQERAIAHVESMLKAGGAEVVHAATGSLCASGDSWCDASESIEASERALVKFHAVLDDPQDWDLPPRQPGAEGPSSSTVSFSPAATECPRTLRALPGPGQAWASVSRVGSGRAVAAQWGMDPASRNSSIQMQMAEVLDKHKEKVTRILAKPAVWDAIMNDEDVQDILREEQARVIPSPEPADPTLQEGEANKVEEDAERGLWGFFTLVQARIEGMVVSIRKLFTPGMGTGEKEKAAESGKAGGAASESADSAGAGSWGVLSGILAVVVAVAVLVLLQRAKRSI